jgi:outer membrane lipoprotein-sorting protein
MKRQLSIILLFVFTAIGLFAQDDPKAKAILAGVSKKYKSYDVVKADFSFNIKSPQSNVNKTENGTIYIRSSQNKYKINLAGQELISNGKIQWTYLKEDNEVQISEINQSADALNPAQIFTIYEKGFKYVYLGETTIGGRVFQNIELAPLTTRSFSKIKLRIDKVNKQINNVVINDKNGNVYSYLIKAFTPNVKVAESIFSFDTKKYPGIDEVDLR